MRALRHICLPVAFAILISSAHAVLPIISDGESLIFSDDFADNSNGWTNVAVVNGTGTATSTQAAITGGAWTPSLQDGQAVSSNYTFASAIDAFNGPISLYMRVRVESPSGTPDGTKFQITLNESTGNRFFRLVVRDNSSGFIEYRNASGLGISSSISSFNFTDNTTFFDFKITLTPGADVDAMASAEAFRYNTGTSTYDSIGSVSDVIDLQTGLFNLVQLNNRNGTNGAVRFDSVAVSTMSNIPEPSAFAGLLGLAGLASAVGRRRRAA